MISPTIRPQNHPRQNLSLRWSPSRLFKQLSSSVPASQIIPLIRLVKFHGITNGKIHCSVTTHDRTDCPLYEALSYVWGLPSPNDTIMIDNQAFVIHQNLHNFLTRLAYGVFPDLRDHLFWIDQLCIDQANNEEKTHQVQMMGKIYKNTHGTVSWLGTEDTGTNEAMKYLGKKIDGPREAFTSTNKARRIVRSLLNKEYLLVFGLFRKLHFVVADIGLLLAIMILRQEKGCNTTPDSFQIVVVMLQAYD